MNYWIVPGFKQRPPISIIAGPERDAIVKIVCSYFNTTHSNIKTRSRTHIILWPRQLCVYLLKENTSMTWQAIADLMGLKDHTTTIASVKRVRSLIDTESSTKELVDYLQSQIA